LFSFFLRKKRIADKKGENMNNYLFISDAAKEVKVESHVLRYWEEELHLPIKRNELGHRYYTEEDVERFKQIKGMKERGLQLKAIKMILKDGKLDVLPVEDVENEKGVQCQGRDDYTDDIVDGGERAVWEGQDADGMTPQAQAAQNDGAQEAFQRKGYQEGVQERAAGSGAVQGRAGQERAGGAAQGRAGRERTESLQGRTGQERMARAHQERMIQGRGQQDRWSQEASGGLAIDIIPAREKESVVQESREDKSKRLQWLLQQLIRQTIQENNGKLCREIRESVVKELDYQFRMQEERDEARDRMLAQRDEEHYKKMDELLRKKSRGLRRVKQENGQGTEDAEQSRRMPKNKQEESADQGGFGYINQNNSEEGGQNQEASDDRESIQKGKKEKREKKKRRFF